MRPGRPLEHYEQVAEIYDEALEVGEPPTQAVADAYDVPYSTAARWVRRARALGCLPPATPGLPRGNQEEPADAAGGTWNNSTELSEEAEVEDDERNEEELEPEVPFADEEDEELIGEGLIDRVRGMAIGTQDPNIVGDAGPTDVPPGADPPE